MSSRITSKNLLHNTLGILVLIFLALPLHTTLAADEDATPQDTIFTNPITESDTGEVDDIIPHEVIVQYTDEEDLINEVENLETELDTEITIVETLEESNVALITTTDENTEEVQNALEETTVVEQAEPNLKRSFLYIPNDTLFTGQWAHRNTGQNVNGTSGTVGASMSSYLAWDNENPSAVTTTVAVIDTGVDYTHPDLASNMWSPSGECKDDFNLTISGGCPNHGWNYENSNNDPIDSGQSNPTYTGHGTFVASMIGAVTNNAQGIAGISLYNKVKVMALRFNFDVFSEIKAINFARYNGADVINASFGGGGSSSIEEDAISAFPGVFVTAAGNGGSDYIGDNIDSPGFYPCNYASNNIICVGASNQHDQLASFSNYSTTHVDVAAPGVNLRGIYRGQYLIGNGTSFATPLVAGAAAMVYASNPTYTPTEVYNAIVNSADTIAGLSAQVRNGKRLNLAKTLQDYSTPPLTDPNLNYAYRFWSETYKGHFYTTSSFERDHIIQSSPSHIWNFEGPSFITYNNPVTTSTKPVYRFYSPVYQGHFYTISTFERDSIIANDPNWNYEGEAYYAETKSNADVTPLYRFWSNTYRHHFYTISDFERDSIIANDPNWTYEGIAFYLPKG